MPYRFLLALLLSLVAWAGTLDCARAHAVLLESVPADGAQLAVAPASVTLRFNEPVSAVFVRLIGAGGRPHETTVQSADMSLTAVIRESLPSGRYLVSWRVMSSDGHPVGGSFAFGVGDATATAPLPDGGSAASRELGWTIASWIATFLRNAALALGIGGAMFAAIVLRGRIDAASGLRRLVVWATGASAVATVVALVAQGGLLSLAPPGAILGPELWTAALRSSRGQSAMVILAGTAQVGIGLMRGSPVMLGSAGIVVAWGLALTGHAASGPWPALTQPLLALHVVVVLFWLGALVPLWLLNGRLPPAELRPLVVRFSTIAVPAVAVLLLAGVGLAASRIRSIDDLLRTDYGAMVLVKAGLAAILLGLAALNRLHVTPRLAEGRDGSPLLSGSLQAEMAAAGLILLLTAALSGTQPPQAPTDHSHEDHASHAGTASSKPFVASQSGWDVKGNISLRPDGRYDLLVVLDRKDGKPEEPQEIVMTLADPAAGIEPSRHQATRTEAGHYRVDGVDLLTSGPWALRIDVLVTDFEKVIVELPVERP